MRAIQSAVVISALSICAGLFPVGSVSALPLSPVAGGAGLVADLGDVGGQAIQVRDRGGGIAAGIIGGMILGGIIASQRPYYYDRPYYYGGYRPYPAGDPAIAYCMRRYKSYDPYSMTYLGYDGLRRPCP